MNMHRMYDLIAMAEDYDSDGRLAQKCASKNPKARKRMYARLLRKRHEHYRNIASGQLIPWMPGVRKANLVDD